MITLRWAPYPGTDVASYKLYRSMIGFKIPQIDPAIVAGKTLIMTVNSTANQTVSFSGTSSVLDQINAQTTGVTGYASVVDASYAYIRDDVRNSPGFITIVGGTALTDLGLSIGTISAKSSDELIATVPANPDQTVALEYADPDGVCQDWYSISSVNSLGDESSKSPAKQPITHSGNLCVIEGIVTDLQGVRIPNTEVVATLVKFPHASELASQITLEPIKTYTGSDGRFSLALLQGALVQLDIEALGYSHNITVPAKAYEFITEMPFDTDYQYPLEYRR